jgi:hypothetical protein
MSRLDAKSKGRFNTDYETGKVLDVLTDYGEGHGDWLDYYRLDEENSEYDEIFDEPVGAGRVFTLTQMPAIHVHLIYGANQYGDFGMYYNDEIAASISFRMFEQAGMTEADIRDGKYERDRVVYKNKVFRITILDIQGQIQRREIVVGLEGSQLKPDELVGDQQFARFSQRNDTSD